MAFTCPNCQMQYDTQAELQKHQEKFCVNSHYADVSKLDNRLADLQNDTTNGEVRANLNEIQSFVKGQDAPQVYRANEVLGEGRFIKSIAGQQHKAQLQSLNQDPQSQNLGTLLEQAEKLKNDRSIQRQLKSDEEKDVLSLLQELEQQKEKELRAAIEKEEIEREINNAKQNPGADLGFMQQEKQRELQRLAQEREAVRLREQGFLDEISKMETSMMQQKKSIVGKFKVRFSKCKKADDLLRQHYERAKIAPSYELHEEESRDHFHTPVLESVQKANRDSLAESFNEFAQLPSYTHNFC